jgi:hypothetical protein
MRGEAMSELKPARVEFELGEDKYQRRSKLIGELEGNGRYIWTIKSEPSSQRDEGEICHSLTTNQLIAIGRVAQQHERKP